MTDRNHASLKPWAQCKYFTGLPIYSRTFLTPKTQRTQKQIAAGNNTRNTFQTSNMTWGKYLHFAIRVYWATWFDRYQAVRFLDHHVKFSFRRRLRLARLGSVRTRTNVLERYVNERLNWQTGNTWILNDKIWFKTVYQMCSISSDTTPWVKNNYK